MQHGHLNNIMSPGLEYFDVNGDVELLASASEDSDCSHLTWRGDPSETGSDWTLFVVSNDLETRTFHVHKSVVIYGQRKSKYLARLMRERKKGRKDESPDKKQTNRSYERENATSTKLELKQCELKNFPIVLDFMYTTGCSNNSCSGDTATTAASIDSYDSLNSFATTESDCTLGDLAAVISTANAVSLRYLARYFEIDALMIVVNKFIQKDLTFSTGPIYLSKAHEYKDDRLIFSAQRLCVENIDRIDSRALLRLPLNLFRTLVKSLESFNDTNESLSLFLSDLICRYIEKHPKAQSSEILLDLTDPLLIPCISSEAAIGFTTIIKNLESTDAKKHWNDILKLSQRCAKSVVQRYGWSDFSISAAVDEYLGNIKGKENISRTSIDCLLFATSFAAALEQAQADHEEIYLEQERLQDLVGTLNNTMLEIERILDQRNDQLEKQQKAIETANETIGMLKAEIGEIRRQNLQKSQQFCEQSTLEGAYLDRALPLRDLVSPSRVGVDVYLNKQRSRDELRTRSEMRSRSIFSSFER
jgi:BTB/POZ domain